MITLAACFTCGMFLFYPMYFHVKGKNRELSLSLFRVNAAALFIIAAILALLLANLFVLYFVGMFVIISLSISYLKEIVNDVEKRKWGVMILIISVLAFWALLVFVKWDGFSQTLLLSSSVVVPIALVMFAFGVASMIPVIQDNNNTRPIVPRLLAVMFFSFIVFSLLWEVPGVLHAGQVTAFDPLSQLFFDIVGDPRITAVLAIMMLGALVKTVPLEPAKWIGDALYIWVPFLIWMLTLLGGVESVPETVLVIFPSYAIFGYVVYVLLMGSVFIIVAAMIRLMTSFSDKFMTG